MFSCHVSRRDCEIWHSSKVEIIILKGFFKFQDPELGNFQSYESLLKKIKDEQKATKEYLEFIKQRLGRAIFLVMIYKLFLLCNSLTEYWQKSCMEKR
jgi:hypothetical protein